MRRKCELLCPISSASQARGLTLLQRTRSLTTCEISQNLPRLLTLRRSLSYLEHTALPHPQHLRSNSASTRPKPICGKCTLPTTSSRPPSVQSGSLPAVSTNAPRLRSYGSLHTASTCWWGPVIAAGAQKRLRTISCLAEQYAVHPHIHTTSDSVMVQSLVLDAIRV